MKYETLSLGRRKVRLHSRPQVFCGTALPGGCTVPWKSACAEMDSFRYTLLYLRMLSPPAAVAGLSPFGKHARSPAPPPPRPLLSQRPPDFLREPEPRPRTGEDGRAPRVSGGRGGRGGPAWGAFHVATAGREREPTDTWVARRGKGQGPREPGPGGEEWSPRGHGKTEGGGGCPGAAIGLSPSSSCSPRGVLPGAGGWLAAGGGFRARPAPC